MDFGRSSLFSELTCFRWWRGLPVLRLDVEVKLSGENTCRSADSDAGDKVLWSSSLFKKASITDERGFESRERYRSGTRFGS